MEIKSFFEKQREKNTKLNIDSNLSEYKIWARKHLELHTKISHLADETKCYKYWIEEVEELNNSDLFIKYLDCFSSIISIGIDRKYDTVEEIQIKPNDYCLSDQFLNLFIGYSATQISESFLIL